MLEINLKGPTNFLGTFAKLIGSQARNGVVKIPKDKGEGYLQGFRLGNSIAMLIRNYEFNESVFTRRMEPPGDSGRVVMSFNNVFYNKNDDKDNALTNLPSIQIVSGKLNSEEMYPSKTKFRSIVIRIETAKLKELLGPNEENIILKNIIANDQPLLFEELVSPQIQKVATEIIEGAIIDSLKNFYFRIKAEELICLLFAELYKREQSTVYALNENDVQKIYQIRNRMLSHLDKPPVIDDLAKIAGMSESKLKRLFKQIMGNSIFNYYQIFRMNEAARLLREEKLPVSEVGYRMGFTNLSHFTKVFEEHIGTKPKKYSTIELSKKSPKLFNQFWQV